MKEKYVSTSQADRRCFSRPETAPARPDFLTFPIGAGAGEVLKMEHPNSGEHFEGNPKEKYVCVCERGSQGDRHLGALFRGYPLWAVLQKDETNA